MKRLLFLFLLTFLGSSIHTAETTKEEESLVDKLPIVYHKDYNVHFFGIEKLHWFDSQKYTRVYKHLKNLGYEDNQFFQPQEVTKQQLLDVHTPEYLESLKKSYTIERILGLPLLRLIPNFLLQKKLLKPMRLATGGTLLAADLALKHGWSINLGGGYHHSKSNSGGGFCIYADIPMAINRVLKKNNKAKTLIVDLDAHQGNGHEDICEIDNRIDIFDMYNGWNYPLDFEARKAITYDFPLKPGTGDTKYLEMLEKELPKAIEQSQPDFIIYNAGTDILRGDGIGRLSISQEAIIKRDEIVFTLAKQKNIPIMMVLSGGYTKQSAIVIGKSIENLLNNVLYMLPEPCKPKMPLAIGAVVYMAHLLPESVLDKIKRIAGKIIS